MSIKGDRIAQRRKMVGWTQEQLAAAAGLTERQISNYETGRTPVPAPAMNKLARALAVDVGWLMGATDTPSQLAQAMGDLSDDERELIRLYRSKSPEARRQAKEILKVL